VAALAADEQKMKHIGPPLTRHQAKEALDWKIGEWGRLGYGWFALFERQSRRFVGEIGLQRFQYQSGSRQVELAYIITKEASGQGYATEAARAVLTFAFNDKKLEKVVSVIQPDNLASQKVLANLGFRFIDQRIAYGHSAMYYEMTHEQFSGGGAAS